MDSYEACDRRYIHEKLSQYYPDGFMPVWATDDMNKVTKGSLQKEKTTIIGTMSLPRLTPPLQRLVGTVFLGTKFPNLRPPLPHVVGTNHLSSRSKFRDFNSYSDHSTLKYLKHLSQACWLVLVNIPQ